METSKKHPFRWVLIASLVTMGLAVLVYFPYLVPAVLAIVWLKFRGTHAIVPYVVYLAFSYLVAIVISAMVTSYGVAAQHLSLWLLLLVVCLTLPPTIASVLSHRAGRRLYESVLWTILASFFGVGAFMAAVYLYTGQNLTTLLVEALTNAMKSNPDFLHLNYDVTTRLMQMVSGAPLENLSNTDAQKLTYLSDIINEVAPAYLGNLMVSFSLLSGFLSVYLPFVFLKNKDVKIAKCPDFKNLRIPKPEWIILIVLFLVTSFSGFTKAYNFQVVANVLRSAITLVFTVQGLVFLTYLFKSKRVGVFGFIMTIILGLMLNMMFWLGLFESLMDIRTKVEAQQNNGGN